MAYPDDVTDLTDVVPADGIAGTTPLGSGTYPHDDHHRDLGVTVEAIQGQLTGAWTSYTPTLTASSVNPTLGSGSSATGYYQRIGRRVEGYVEILFGSSGVAPGTGYYGLLLPVQPVNRNQAIGIGYCFDSDEQLRFVVASAAVATGLWAASTSKAIIVVTNDPGEGFGTGDNPVGAAVPWAWEEGDQIHLRFAYEAAAAS